MKLLLYCCKNKRNLLFDRHQVYHNFKRFEIYGKDVPNDVELNGKIVAECDFEIEEIIKDISSVVEEWYSKELLKKTCSTAFELDDYLQGKNGYAIHIKNLHIFDEPRELSDYESFAGYKKYYQINDFVKLEKAPQNMCKVLKPYIRFNKDFKAYEDFDILISIRPEWLCKILNGEKTIEVRKKILKEMRD